jgi:ABC-2 type transport system permease protein
MKASSPRRIGALVLRHLYIMRGSWLRVLEMAYWPAVQMVVWGFITQFFLTHSSWVAQATGVFLAAVLLWDVLFRGNLGVALSFMEEMWSRNLGHLFVSPLRPMEMVIGLLTMSLIRTLVGVIPAALLCIPLYNYSIFSMGLALLVFFVNLLVTGWALGLTVAALVLRFGQSAESLAWVCIFALAPLSGIYYPIDVLPAWLQPVAWILPTTPVFEGMRGVLFGKGIDLGLFALAAGLNILYLIAAILFFLRIIHVARVKGLLLDMGE